MVLDHNTINMLSKRFCPLVKGLNNRRSFWNLAKGTSIGYIESVSTVGMFFTHKNITFRKTSSNMSHGYSINISASKFSMGDDFESNVEKAMYERLPVTISYERDMIGSPRVGFVGFLSLTDSIYITKFDINEDTIDIMKIK